MSASCFIPSKHHALYLLIIVNEVTNTEVFKVLIDMLQEKPNRTGTAIKLMFSVPQ